MPRIAFEDFTPGSTRILGPITVTKEEIITFAREYDPQPFHIDEVAAKDTFVGTLIASGWHTCALNMKLLADEVLLDSTSMGSPGIDELKWARPVRPGDNLRSRMTVTGSRVSKSRPEIGFVNFQFDVLNQNDEAVMIQKNCIMFGLKETGLAVNGTRPLPPAQPPSPAPEIALAPISANPYLEDLVVNQTDVLGRFTFTAENIIPFAKAYDPQRFHVDPEAAKVSLFGDLCASGWQTAAVWMKLMAAHRDRIRADALARGERPARLGPSPGFKNLKWLKPIYAGDTITYRSTVTGTRASATRPGWGIASHHNSGINQYGEEVFSFDGAVFWERRSER
ncbi:MaoC family dehydratase [Microvirga puerhi]|uniref:MaoC family dehydratase n=1 Tax=Microvirga puerhi TaxID=2876078 RepID=A0ABS7VRX9_9HYPH|nr:MaoC family dehydratase [Microvirga puerhi]MBZ6078311.1 MaoC family dehydratase [Microvirga puerhi]